MRERISRKTEGLGRECAREKDGACEQARMWKRLKLILYKKKKVASAFQTKKNLTCPVDRDHLYVMKSHSKFRITK